MRTVGVIDGPDVSFVRPFDNHHRNAEEGISWATAQHGGAYHASAPPLRAGFILERSVAPSFMALPFGANDTKDRARVTNTPPFSSMSRLCRKAEKDWWVCKTQPFRACKANQLGHKGGSISRHTSPSTSFVLSPIHNSCPMEYMAIARFESRCIVI